MNRDLLFQFYLVAFIDLLGQRESLRRITNLPTSEDQQKEFIELIKQSYGKVSLIRQAFKQFFDASSDQIPDVGLVAPEHREQFLASQKSEIHFFGLSDAIVVCVPLMSNDENCTAINGVYSTFVATGGISFIGLSGGIAVRAGLDVGIATQIDNSEIYGPALEKAVHLESQMAEYPRFVLGNGLRSYLAWVENQEYTSPLGQIAKNTARLCREMVIRDTDGRYMLDFLGPRMKEAAGDSIKTETFIKAHKFVEAECMRYTEQANEKLASRYFRLLRYFQHGQGVWEP